MVDTQPNENNKKMASSIVTVLESPRGTHYFSHRPAAIATSEPDGMRAPHPLPPSSEPGDAQQVVHPHPPQNNNIYLYPPSSQTMQGSPPYYYQQHQHPPHHSNGYPRPHGAQYNNAPQVGFYDLSAPPPPMAPPPQHPLPRPDRFYPPGHHPGHMFNQSWPGPNDVQMPNNFYYDPAPYAYQAILPHSDAVIRRGSGRGKSSKKGKEYQQRRPSNVPMELNPSYYVENEHLLSALILIQSNPNATLFDIDGMICEVACSDERAARFIQQRLRLGTVKETSLGLTAALAELDMMWRDQYGHFMIEGLFEFGSNDMRTDLMDAIYKCDVVALCMHMNGCRVIQKALRCLGQEEVCKLITTFQDKVMAFIFDPNGNHVIQRSIQVLSEFAKADDLYDCGHEKNELAATSVSDQMQLIVDDITKNVEVLSTHRYGCRVVQRAVENCKGLHKHALLDEIISCHEKLIIDQYGNYVIQQVLTCGGEDYQAAILKTLTKTDALLKFCKHKYASNVIEAVLVHGNAQHKKEILDEMLKDTREEGWEDGGYCCVIELSKDPIANYVVNKALENCEEDVQEKIFDLISSAREELGKFQYAKYVLARLDKRMKPSVGMLDDFKGSSG